MSSPLVAIIADDLTGALDASAPFAECGFSTCVAANPTFLKEVINSDAQVIAVNTCSRHSMPRQAADVVENVAQHLKAHPNAILFKKIDSRLKGHIAAELEAALDGLGIGKAVICPAIPDMGRFVAGGKVQGSGIPEDLTIVSVLGSVAGHCRISDAGTQADMDGIAKQVLASHAPILAVGARGLAWAFARCLATQNPGAQSLRSPFSLPRPIFFGIGSRDPITLTQVTTLKSALAPMTVEAPDGKMGHPDSLGGIGMAMFLMVEGAAMRSPVEAAQNFAEGFAEEVRRHCPRALVLSGGDTASAVLEELGVGVLRVAGEVLPGLPLCHADLYGDEITLVTKSGGFGDPETLLRLAALDYGSRVSGGG